MSNRFFPNYKGYILTSPFGMRNHPTYGTYRMHNGVDIVATNDGEVGQADKIMAHTGGTVCGVGYDSSAGNFVNIRVAKDTIMAYYHMRDLSTLEVGDVVKAGDIIGIVGMTGTASGRHLHWGIKVGDTWIDPTPYLDADYPVEEPKKEPGTYGTVTCTYLRIRSGAGTNHNAIGGLSKGETVKILETTSVGNTVWGRFEKGWICLSNYVELETIPENPDEEQEKTTFTVEMNILKRGMKGNEVKGLQTLLFGYQYNIDKDGSFGPATEKIVKEYQKRNGLPATGVVDETTFKSMIGL